MKTINGFKNIHESFKTRQVKYGGYAALVTLAVIVGLILVNLLIGQFTPQVDLTSSKLYSLSDQTLQVLDSIKTPVKFYGLWRPGEENQDVMTVVNLCLAKCHNISFEVIDPDRNPGFVVKYDKDKKGITRGSLIVEGEKGFRVIGPYDMYDFTQNQQGGRSVTGNLVERRITSALLFAGTGTTPVVYEMTGHGETPLSAINFQDTVERENYSLKSLNLLVSPIPSDAAGLILNNPQRDLNPSETEKLLNYLEKGGRLLVLADYTIRDLSNLNQVLASYGLAFQYGIVVESDPNYVIANNPMSELPDLVDHDITKPLLDKNSNSMLLFGAMPLSTLDTKRRTVDIKPLMNSSASAFLRTDLSQNSAAKLPSDLPGPFTLGMAVMDPSYIQGDEAQTRIVVIGCGTLLNIAAQGFDANRDVFMNSLTWLQDRPENITVRSKSLFVLPMRLNLVQIVIFGLVFILIIPLAFFITGFVTWLKRRHL